ncbi:MAG TPA: RIP metalloprotease RseP [Spongiibacteraceae bacterium]|nr:RIP metalloprotease RseP [Spongiibacteraceae bacterium]
MPHILQTLLVTAVTLAVVVTIHEFGHFWVARRCGVKVLRFCIGFGKPLWSRLDRHGTEFAIAAVPLGGYVKMLDEREGEVPAELLPQSFMRKPVTSRIAIVAAGPIANLLLAIALFWVIYMAGISGVTPVIGSIAADSPAARAGLEVGQEIVAVDGASTPTAQALQERLLRRIGETGTLQISLKNPDSDLVERKTIALENWLAGAEAPDMIEGLGIELWYPRGEPVVADVVPDSPAAHAGFAVGDRIESADGTSIANWRDWQDYVRARPEQVIHTVVVRADGRHDIELTPARKVDDKGAGFGLAGLAGKIEWPENMKHDFRYGPIAAMGKAFERTWATAAISLDTMKKMLLGMVSAKNLSGPITIAKVATASAESGWQPYLAFLAFLSVSLGVLNLLPIPVLDGGHILFSLPELLTGKPLSAKVQAVGYQVGLFVVIGVMVLALYNDLLRLW